MYLAANKEQCQAGKQINSGVGSIPNDEYLIHKNHDNSALIRPPFSPTGRGPEGEPLLPVPGAGHEHGGCEQDLSGC